MENPTTLLELCDRFADDHACWSYSKQVRWPKGFVCPRCQAYGASFVGSRRLWQCRQCRHQASITAGTIFHGTRVPLRKWFGALFFPARHKQGISALQLQRDLGLGSDQTAWTMLHKLRSALCRRPGQLLQGIVEADETFVGGARSGGKRRRGAPNKTMVAVLVARRKQSAGAAYLGTVPDGSFESSGPVLRGTFRGVSHKQLPSYLVELTDRLNRRGIEDRFFFSLTRRAVEGAPLPYSRLTAAGIGSAHRTRRPLEPLLLRPLATPWRRADAR